LAFLANGYTLSLENICETSHNASMVSILFVCLGNICRSPAAEGVMNHLAKKITPSLELHVQSCGLGDWHKGQLPDERMRKTAKSRGIILTSRAQAFDQLFFDKFDYILAADHKVMYELHKWAKNPEHKAKIILITKFSKTYKDKEIPDPYYLDQGHFELVMDMMEEACQRLLEHLMEEKKSNR
jgi:protein-tyrosine phosphatase